MAGAKLQLKKAGTKEFYKMEKFGYLQSVISFLYLQKLFINKETPVKCCNTGVDW